MISSISWPQHSQVKHVMNEAGLGPASPGTSRSWTFVPSNYARLGQPRGLVHAMAIKRQSKEVFRDDVKGLMREIDMRLNDCRELSTRPAPTPPPSSCTSRRGSHFL